jgi:hypothetical protein
LRSRFDKNCPALQNLDRTKNKNKDKTMAKPLNLTMALNQLKIQLSGGAAASNGLNDVIRGKINNPASRPRRS